MPEDERWLRYAFALAEQSVREGDYAFGCVVVDRDGRVLAEALQTVVRSGDWLGHAEMNALSELSARLTRPELVGATLYSSTEPCPMCTGAIGWSVSRLVFGLSQAAMYRLFEGDPRRFVEPWQCRPLLEGVRPAVEVIGPLLEDEGAEPHLQWIRLQGPVPRA